MQSVRMSGLLVGFTLGIVWMWLGFGAALLVGLLGLLGWVVGSVVANAAAGNVNLSAFWNDLIGRDRASP
jgi:hypothetical protein